MNHSGTASLYVMLIVYEPGPAFTRLNMDSAVTWFLLGKKKGRTIVFEGLVIIVASVVNCGFVGQSSQTTIPAW